MRILVFTDSKVTMAGFGSLSRSRNHTVEFIAHADLRNALSAAGSTDYLYLDATGMSPAALRVRMKQLAAGVENRFGIIDRNGTIKDAAEVFHRGATDYVDAKLLKQIITTGRFLRAVEFANDGTEPCETVEPLRVPLDVRPSGIDWESVENGQEYTFQMIYVGLDFLRDLRRKTSGELLQTLRRTLQSILTRTFSTAQGRIWVWKEDDGVLLCPFNGEQTTALIPALRLELNKVLLTIEHFSVNTSIGWRMGLHVGNTPYRDSGKTSGIVSESLNFIFHLGQRAVKPGQLAVTETAMAFARPGIKECFTRNQVFEGESVFLLRNFA